VRVDPANAVYRPRFFLASAVWVERCLAACAGAMVERFGADADRPGNSPPYLDTDTKAISGDMRRRRRRRPEGLRNPGHPLRDPQYYRSASRGPLEWLSRRCCSISHGRGRVEGSGGWTARSGRSPRRLAHAPSPLCLEMADPDEALSACGADPARSFHRRRPAAVFLVASLCGGTGAGRRLTWPTWCGSLLGELGLEHDVITGMLLHATSCRPTRNDIQVANAIACLRELRHFSTPGWATPGIPLAVSPIRPQPIRSHVRPPSCDA